MAEDFEPEEMQYLEDPKDLLSYTAFDSIAFMDVDKNLRRRVYRFARHHSIGEVMDVFAYSCDGTLFVEFEYEILLGIVEQTRQFEQMIGFCRDLAKKFPGLESDWIDCLYERNDVYYKIHQGSLLVAEATIQPDLNTVRKVD